MSKLKKHTPEGFMDLIYPESFIKRKLEDSIRGVFTSYAYKEIKTPGLEYYDIFDDDIFPPETMFKCFDQHGKILVLKPDLTVAAARLAASRMKNEPLPLRLCYVDSVIHFDEVPGRKKEIAQAGAELMGIISPEADAEIIAVAIQSLLAAGMKEFKIDLGHADFFNGITEGVKLKVQEKEKLRECIDKKDGIELNKQLASLKLGEERSAILKKLPELYGGPEIIEDVGKMKLSDTSREGINYISDILQRLKSRGLDGYITIDLGMVRRLNYYTGTIFRGYAAGSGYPILNGGRYDKLLDTFGKNMPAIGFSISMDELMAALKPQLNDIEVPKTEWIVGYSNPGMGASVKAAGLLREKGFSVEETLCEKSYNEAVNYSEVKKAKKLMYFIDDNTAMVRDIEEGRDTLKAGDDIWNI